MQNEKVLIEQIEAKYSNKIILNVGLGIVFYDFITIGDPYIYPGQGAPVQIVQFRLVVFRPFVGEVLTGRVIQSNKDGIKISLEFFDDIIVPSTHLQNPSVFNSSSNLWIWKYETEGDAAAVNEFPLTIGEVVSILSYFDESCYLFAVCIRFGLKFVLSVSLKLMHLHAVSQLRRQQSLTKIPTSKLIIKDRQMELLFSAEDLHQWVFLLMKIFQLQCRLLVV